MKQDPRASPFGHPCALCGAVPEEKCRRKKKRAKAHDERKETARLWRLENLEPRKKPGERRKEQKAVYAAYLESETWRSIRQEVLARDDYRCRAYRCQVTQGLNVHHSKYPRILGEEPLDWLVTLCIHHHGRVHSLRKRRGVTLDAATQKVLTTPS